MAWLRKLWNSSPHVTVQVWDGFTATTFFTKDGFKMATLFATHTEIQGQRNSAEWLGCSVEKMNAEHDLLHSMIAQAIGLPFSPTLFGEAQKAPVSKELSDAEEAAVMAVHRFAILAGVNLVGEG